MLCAVCVWMFQGPESVGEHHSSFGNLVKAAQAGCKICKALLRYREESGPDEYGERVVDPFTTYRIGLIYGYGVDSRPIQFSAEVDWLPHNPPKTFRLHIAAPQTVPIWWTQFLQDTTSDLLAEPWRVRNDQFPSRNIPTNTGDVEVSRLAFEWLDNCRSCHSTCEMVNESRDPSFFPPRLLQISNKSPTCHLVFTKDLHLVERKGYVALSHCWGESSSMMTLTAHNMDRMKDCIPLNDLPRSFFEAIQVCQRLGFRYIWIDSLCIVQSGPGSEEDWQRHAATMNTIYANCSLNIAIAHASNSTQGCFVDRIPDIIQAAFVYAPIIFSHENSVTTSDSYSSHEHSSESIPNVTTNTDASNGSSPSSAAIATLVTIFDPSHDVGSALNDHPLQKRGWVFQERLMAPRTLHFGKDRIFWECNERSLNEYLPWGLPQTGDIRSFGPELPFSLPAIVLSSDPESHLDQTTTSSYMDDYHNLVSHYSGTDLTYPSKDKLVAFGAVAARFGRVLPGPYVAGLFLSYNPLGLLWVATHDTLKSHASDVDFELITIETKRDPVLGAPSWSWASVDSHTYCIISNRKFDSCEETPCFHGDVESISIELVEPTNPYGQVRSAEITVEGPMSSIPPLQAQELVDREDSMRDDLFALYLVSMKYNGYKAYGLVLALVSPGMYRRVGIIRRSGFSSFEPLLHDMDRVSVRII